MYSYENVCPLELCSLHDDMYGKCIYVHYNKNGVYAAYYFVVGIYSGI